MNDFQNFSLSLSLMVVKFQSELKSEIEKNIKIINKHLRHSYRITYFSKSSFKITKINYIFPKKIFPNN